MRNTGFGYLNICKSVTINALELPPVEKMLYGTRRAIEVKRKYFGQSLKKEM